MYHHRPPPRPFPGARPAPQPRIDSTTNLFNRVWQKSSAEHAEQCASQAPVVNPQPGGWRSYDPSPVSVSPVSPSATPMSRFASLVSAAELGEPHCNAVVAIIGCTNQRLPFSTSGTFTVPTTGPRTDGHAATGQHHSVVLRLNLADLPYGDQAASARSDVHERPVTLERSRCGEPVPGGATGIPDIWAAQVHRFATRVPRGHWDGPRAGGWRYAL